MQKSTSNSSLIHPNGPAWCTVRHDLGGPDLLAGDQVLLAPGETDRAQYATYLVKGHPATVGPSPSSWTPATGPA